MHSINKDHISAFLHSLEGDYSYTVNERTGPVYSAIVFCFICPALFIYAAWADQLHSGLTTTQELLLACGMSIASFAMGYVLYARSRHHYVITSSHITLFSRPGKLKWSIPIDGITFIDFPLNSGKFSMRLYCAGKTVNIDLPYELRIKIRNCFDKTTNQLKIL